MIGEATLVAYTASVSVVMFYMVADLGRSIARSILGTPTAIKTLVTEIIPAILVSTLNNTLVLRNKAIHLVNFVGAGALQVINNVKDVIIYIIGGAIQEVIKVVHLMIHIGIQTLQLIQNIYKFVFSGMEAVYVIIKTVNDGIWYTVNGVYVITDTIVSAPGKMYNITITAVNTFVEETVYPSIDWFLYGPKISNTRYYLFLIMCVFLCSVYNWYINSKYSKRNQVPKFIERQVEEKEKAA